MRRLPTTERHVSLIIPSRDSISTFVDKSRDNTVENSTPPMQSDVLPETTPTSLTSTPPVLSYQERIPSETVTQPTQVIQTEYVAHQRGAAVRDINSPLLPAMPEKPRVVSPSVPAVSVSQKTPQHIQPHHDPDEIPELHPVRGLSRHIQPKKVRRNIRETLKNTTRHVQKKITPRGRRQKTKVHLRPTHIMSVSIIGVLLSGAMTVLHFNPRLPLDIVGEPVKPSSGVLAATTDLPVAQNNPSDTKVSTNDITSYTTSASLPRIVSIDAIGVRARVTKVAETTQGQLKAPGNIHDAGWYQDSARTGAAGVSMLVGAENDGGVFARLQEVKMDDIVNIERGDGVPFKFKVQRIERGIASETIETLLQTPDASVPWLVMVTCTNEKDMVCASADRTVIFAKQI